MHTSIEKWHTGRLWAFEHKLNVEWSASRFRSLELRFFTGDSDRGLQLMVGLFFFSFWITLEPFFPRSWQPKVDWERSFGETRASGISYHDHCLWLQLWADEGGSSRSQPWYMRTHCIHMPWDRGACIRTSYLMKDGTWWDEPPHKGIQEWQKLHDYRDEHRHKEVHPYTYTLKSGKVQERLATVMVEEREWRQRWLRWTKWRAEVSRTIWVKFSDEVGERTGSWKGGTTGCGYELREGETPLECLRRMESERKF